MHGQVLVAECDEANTEPFAQLAAAVSAWEPAFELVVPPRDARLFEPDGTLYAVAIGPTHTIRYNHRERVISSGDLIVVPCALALDVEPEVRMLGIRYVGPAPDHFRERFIQVWGFEHIPGSSAKGGTSAGDS